MFLHWSTWYPGGKLHHYKSRETGFSTRADRLFSTCASADRACTGSEVGIANVLSLWIDSSGLHFAGGLRHPCAHNNAPTQRTQLRRGQVLPVPLCL